MEDKFNINELSTTINLSIRVDECVKEMIVREEQRLEELEKVFNDVLEIKKSMIRKMKEIKTPSDIEKINVSIKNISLEYGAVAAKIGLLL